jgi:glucose/arabinose dehydrogenase
VIGSLVTAACLAVAGPCASERAAELSLQRVASGFDAPVHVVFPPSEPGRFYVVEQRGVVWRLANGNRSIFIDIRAAVQSGGEQGLLSIAFHPRYKSNRRFYLNYTDNSGDTRVVEYRANPSRTRALLNTRRQLFSVDQPYSNHNGGLSTFGPDGKLYTGMGDGGSGGDPENRAQNLGTLLGKLVTIDVDRRGAKPQIAALGLRNPWRFSWDRKTRDLYIADVGQGEWEEIDFIPWNSPGLENYGWDVYEGNEKYEDKSLSRGRLVQPVAVYSHDEGCSVTGGFVYRGSKVPAAVGRYFYGDYCSGRVWSLVVRNGKAQDVRREPFEVENLSSFGEDAAGELYFVAHGGTIYRLAD